jgi:ABC-type transporter Mla subunit MlaD
MRTERIALSVALAVGGMVAQGAAFAQENRGTMEQQMACTPDVWRLCSDQIPDVNRITACLQQNTPQLSSACRAVFQSNNQMPPPQSMQRGRAVPPPRYNAVPPPPPRPDDDDD